MAYEILFAESVAEHLGHLTAAERARVLDAVERQLAQQPLIETRNRKGTLSPHGICESGPFGCFMRS